MGVFVVVVVNLECRHWLYIFNIPVEITKTEFVIYTNVIDEIYTKKNFNVYISYRWQPQINAPYTFNQHFKNIPHNAKKNMQISKFACFNAMTCL